MISKKFSKWLVLWGLFLHFFLLSGVTAFAVMPPEHYHRQADESLIKAVARVADISVLSETREGTRKSVMFDRIQGLNSHTPSKFSGTCYSVEHAWQRPMPGKLLYYYPVINQVVLVTVSADKSHITSFTPLDKVLEAEIHKNGLENIYFEMGKARIRQTR